jgi:cell wall-associated NlpC family hydrolase
MSGGTVVMNDLTLRAAAFPGDSWRPPQPEAALYQPRRRGQRPRPIARTRRAIVAKLTGRPVAATAATCTLICALLAPPAYADPAGTGVPDAGVRPLPAGPVQFPGLGTTGPTNTGPQAGAPVYGPLGTQIMSEEIAVGTLEGQALQASLDYETARDTAASAEQAWQTAVDNTAELRVKADSAAADAYKAAAGLPGPYGDLVDDLHKLSVLAPGLSSQPGGEGAARDLLRAEREEQAAHDAFLLANSFAQTAKTKADSLGAQRAQRTAALADLKSRNSAELARVEAQRQAYEQSLGGANLADNSSVDGMQANPAALAAVARALSKMGAPYLWAAEGPDRFDCSGLAYWSYKIGPGANASLALPRVANEMYHATPAVPATRFARGDLLLPGDLVFFATSSSDWRTIYHMGIYIGGGRMVHAPSTGDVVKISPVMWSRFFGATRIYKAVPKQTSTPPVQPGPTTASASASATATPGNTDSSTSASTSTSTSASSSSSSSSGSSSGTGTGSSTGSTTSTGPSTGSSSSGSHSGGSSAPASASTTSPSPSPAP